MHIYAAKLAVKNWERIKRGQANCVLLASYRDAIEVNLPWLLGDKVRARKKCDAELLFE